jgi:uncharacterized integral membrane protein
MAEDPAPHPAAKPDSDERVRQLKLGGIGVLALVGLVLVIQNSGETTVNLLFWSVRMPLVFLLVVIAAIGAGLDRAWSWRRRQRQQRRDRSTDGPEKPKERG